MTLEIPSKRKRARVRGTPKGRAVDPKAREEVRSLLGEAPRRRDLLIEHLHKIQDRFGCLSAAHLVALAAEMKMAMAEVYEVATFYHHFDVVKEGDVAPPAITVRVCDSIACDLAGSHELLKKLPALLGQDVRVLHAPCVGRCETAPVAVVGQNPVPFATAEKVASLVTAKALTHSVTDIAITPGHIDYVAYRAARGYRLAASCVGGSRSPADIIELMESSGLRGLGGAGFPAGRKWKIVAAEPAPRLMAINIDEGEPGTFKDRYYLERDPHRFLEGAIVAAWAVGIDTVYIYLRDEYRLPRHPRARARCTPGGSAVQDPAISSSARSRSVYLRRRVGDDRVNRGQARRAAASSTVCCAGRAVWPSDARAQHGNAALGARDRREGA